jgi:hypothetical protein
MYIGPSREVLSMVNRRRKTLWLISLRLSYCPHCTMSMPNSSDVFGDTIISSGMWPARSPYFNPSDFIWSILKNKVYKSNHRTEELKENIRREFVNILAEHLQRVNYNLFHRCEECLHTDGEDFRHLLWSVNCNYVIPNVIGKIRTRLAAGGESVAVNRRAVNRST